MVFNSYSFAIFLPIFFTIYFLLRNSLKYQNYFILLSSLVFYGYWDYRFLGLLIFNCVVGYYFGLWMGKESDPKKRSNLMFWAVVINLGLLFYFKYFNFFIGSFNQMAETFGYKPDITTLNIILPIGISFYTFHSLSYLFDINQEKLEPTKDFVAYAGFVCFFPQLVAGPISRAADMLPKFLHKRTVDGERMTRGISQMTLGFFKKMAVADTIAVMVDESYKNVHVISDFQILLAAIFYAFQIYCDFSGYSDIALGLGKIFGIEFKVNFNRPFMSKSVTEFWQRWHISLSTWLNDYLFTPLVIAFRNLDKLGVALALFITFFLSGLWHGAGWNFIIFGVLYGIAMIYEFYTRKKRKKIAKKLPQWLNDYLSMFFVFVYAVFTWIFFRSQTFGDAIYIVQHIFMMDSFQLLNLFVIGKIIYLVSLVIFIDIYFFNYYEKNNYATFFINIFLLINTLLFATFGGNAFIYFQF
ncbi:MBOAT family protein [Mucilaginibacter hurinus]|uniref:MBOAT family protein n=1 Tax=Mucilaginibacter hurinus TaxID=2201324 RepID=A0A367GPA8_9SPHI|nr:MBOAT family O-acyltransferase [Mucilaginibacter hurinus]RCH54885.1 MBOAT family protein [Mucilaginibacter hurinus]